MARILLIDDDANRPDIVVTDTIMPNQEGIETVIKQTRTAPEVAIIAMSGGGRTAIATSWQWPRSSVPPR